MTLTAISLLESARRKFFMNRRTSCLESRNQTFLGSGDRNDSYSQQVARIGEKKIFHESTYITSRKQESNVLGSGARNDSNSQQLARIGEKKIFHEHDVHHVQKVGIKRFWAQETEMTLTANSSKESARRKFFMNLTYIMSRKQESNAFGLRRPK